MKVVHLNTFDTGGAATACDRLHNGLTNKGVESNVLVLHKTQDRIKYHSFLTQSFPFTTRIRNSLKARWLRAKRNRILSKVKTCERLSLPFSPYSVERHPLIQASDIIHLHWISDFLDYPTFFKKIDKPVVWTLHDTNPFGGLFHYPLDLEYNKHLKPQDNYVFSRKRNILNQAKNLHFISLCRWMQQKLMDSRISVRSELVPNGINTQLYAPIDKSSARQYFNIPHDKKVILFVAENVENHRKGFHLLEQIMRSLSDPSILLCTLGNSKRNIAETMSLGFLTQEETLVKAYSAADVFVIPSLEDNLPNTAIEAMSCAVPVVGFNVGGLPDIIDDGINGELATAYDILDFARKVTRILEDQGYRHRLSINAREKVKTAFELNSVVNAHLEIYKQISA